MMKILVAVGGNALLQRGEPMEAIRQIESANRTGKALQSLVKEHKVTLTHGNGPQVGLLALQNDAYKSISPYPFDILGAETEGMIGYLLAMSLNAAIFDKKIITIITRVEVSKDDPAMADPTKFVGPVYEKADADKLAEEKGWLFKLDGKQWRRVVPSPTPTRFLEKNAINLLMTQDDTIVIASGGGGIPVIRNPKGGFIGVEAVVDKDLSGQLLAREINADFFLILTDTEGVFLNWGEPNQEQIREIPVAELRKHKFPAGSMGPKVNAACLFVELTGKKAGIGKLEQAADIVAGRAGTIVVP
ncbi:MAG: carbamate kinase [Spirochaeta sp. LUC14_002_19_P3]|nr:MAG: carbamate kinase [Spirochaeta sp. LUC14_002_19_P3]